MVTRWSFPWLSDGHSLVRGAYASPVPHRTAQSCCTNRLAEVGRALESFYRFFERYERVTKASFYTLIPPAKRGGFDPGVSDFLADVARLRESFLSCTDDDFNTGGAVGSLYELLTALNRFADARGLEGAKLERANLERANCSGANLKDVNLIEANLKRANFTGGGEPRAHECLTSNRFTKNPVTLGLFSCNLSTQFR